MKEAKKAFREHSQTKRTTSSVAQKPAKAKMVWTFQVGDLVEYKSNNRFEKGVIVGATNGFFEVLSSSGKKWVKAQKIRSIQKISQEIPGHAK